MSGKSFEIKNAQVGSTSEAIFAILVGIIRQSQINHEYLYNDMRANIKGSSDEGKQIIEDFIEVLKHAQQVR
jgi:hypothetical protein